MSSSPSVPDRAPEPDWEVFSDGDGKHVRHRHADVAFPLLESPSPAAKADPYAAAEPTGDPDDCGMCLRASDIDVPVPGNPIAYPHPGCPHHGYCETFTPSEHKDGDGRVMCADCRAYADEHHYRRQRATPEEVPNA
jgi:hypothetical protein